MRLGFIEMDGEAIARVIQAPDGQEMGGRALRVNEAQGKPRGGGGSGHHWLASHLLGLCLNSLGDYLIHVGFELV